MALQNFEERPVDRQLATSVGSGIAVEPSATIMAGAGANTPTMSKIMALLRLP